LKSGKWKTGNLKQLNKKINIKVPLKSQIKLIVPEIKPMIIYDEEITSVKEAPVEGTECDDSYDEDTDEAPVIGTDDDDSYDEDTDEAPVYDDSYYDDSYYEDTDH